MTQDRDSLSRQMDDWAKAIDRFMDHMNHMATAQEHRPFIAVDPWRPAVNVYETEQAIVVLVELAGVVPEDMSVHAEVGQLVIQGQRHPPMPEIIQRLHQVEIQSGPFAFQIPLPTNIDASKAKATYRNGLLQVCLPKQSNQNQQSTFVYIHLSGGA